MKLLDRLDEIDYRLHLHPRPGSQGPRALSRGRIRFLRVLWSLLLAVVVLAGFLGMAYGHWSALLPSLMIPAAVWWAYGPDTRRQILRVHGHKE